MKRIQRSRRKGSRLPPSTICVDRSNKKYGNPFRMQDGYSREEAIAHYRAWIEDKIRADPHYVDDLRGADYLACFCRQDQLKELVSRCHADILLEFLLTKQSS